MVALDGNALNNAAEYLRGKIKAVPNNTGSVSDQRARDAHFDLYQHTRRNALVLWLETGGIHGHPNSERGAVTSASSAAKGRWPGGGEEKVPCLLWCSGHWHCASAGWCDQPEENKNTLKVSFTGYDVEDAVIVPRQDPRIRRAVLDPRCGRDHPNTQVLKGIFPKIGDHVRVHVLDAAEAPIFLQQGVYLTGAVASSLAAHDSSLVSVVGLAGEELFLVPNTRMEHVTAAEFARVVETLKVARNKVLRQLDITTSQTIAIEIISGVGNVADDNTPLSLWALGDQMLIRVWQQKGEFMLTTSVSASQALAAVGMEDTGLNVLSDGERRQLLDRVRDRIRVSHGLLEMEMETRPNLQCVQTANTTKEIHRETFALEGVSVEIVVEREGGGGLRVRSTTLPPGPQLSYHIIAQPEDWAPLGHPSLLWLDRIRTASLARQLARCLRARDGSLTLQIGRRRTLRSEGFIPMPPSPQGNSPNRTSPRFCAASTENNQPINHDEHAEVSPCGASGVPSGLCSCRVVLRTGVSLPLSIAEPPKGDDCTESSENNDGNSTASASSRSRWLVLVKATGGELTLSLLRPSRAGTPNCGLDVHSQAPGAICTSAGGSRGGNYRGAHQPKSMLRQPRSIVTTWKDWAQLGYGPLQWMSHAQKALIARLSLYWVSLKPPTETLPCLEDRAYAYTPKQTFQLPEEAFLQVRPILYSLSRVVGTPSETLASTRRGGNSQRPSMSAGSGSDRKGLRAARVFVRDEGSVLRVEVEVEVDERGEGQSQHVVQRLEQTFGKEVWQETGLGELLWLDCSGRGYLARRLAQQVAVDVHDTEEGSDGQQDRENINELAKLKLVIVSDLPLLYWAGTVVIARLGSHAAGVFVTITDAGRRLLIEARDFEAGPVLATSMVPLEAWTAAMGMATLQPPRDDTSFKSTLEDKLATLLGAGSRSCTSRLEKKRAARQAQQQQPQNRENRRWRGTFLQLSEMEKGLWQAQLDHNSDGETGDSSSTGTAKQQQQSPLPPVSPRNLSPLEQKRALRLEMLTRMIDEFHAKHGRRRGGGKGGKPRKKSVCISDTPDSAAAVRQRKNNEMDGLNSNQGRDLSETAGESREQEDDIVGTPLPAIRPSPPAAPERHTDGEAAVVRRRSLLAREDNPASTADSSSSIGGDGESSVSFPTPVTPLHFCVCCGAEGGLGHGRRCAHTFRRCGFCRVEEAKRVLGIQDTSRRARRGTSTSRPERVPKCVVVVGDAGKDEDEFEWVTDSDEEDPEFECDSCGRVIEDTADRFHCETCGDYDLCQECFLPHKVSSEQEDGGKVRHMVSHDVTRIMGNPAVPDSALRR